MIVLGLFAVYFGYRRGSEMLIAFGGLCIGIGVAR